MSLKRLEIQGLRGFETLQELEFAVPSGILGSGLTILVGPNNGGKSTVVEALRSLRVGSPLSPVQPQSFTEGRRNKRAKDRVSIRATDSSGDAGGICTVAAGGSETEWSPSKTSTEIFALPSRRYFSPYFHKSEVTRETYISQYGSPQNRGGPLDQFGARLFQVQRDRAKFDELLGKVVQPVPNWTIEQSDQGQHYLKVEKSGAYHSSEGMGEGLVSLLLVIDALYDSEPGTMIVIDEPELSLHPSLQRKLSALLVEYSEDRQVVIATHSPYFVDFDALFSGAKISRVHSDDHGAVISPVSKQTVDALKSFADDYRNPHTLGLNAREAFFLEDEIVLVEGQEDVIFYEKIAAKLGMQIKGNFFGWGVGGAGNMARISALLKDLGFEKVVGILDKDKVGDLPSLSSKFPKYSFYAIPADDVRTKEARKETSRKEGILDENYEIRSEFREDMKRHLSKVNDVF